MKTGAQKTDSQTSKEAEMILISFFLPPTVAAILNMIISVVIGPIKLSIFIIAVVVGGLYAGSVTADMEKKGEIHPVPLYIGSALVGLLIFFLFLGIMSAPQMAKQVPFLASIVLYSIWSAPGAIIGYVFKRFIWRR